MCTVRVVPQGVMLLVRRLRWPSLLLAHGEDAASEDAAVELQRLADADPSVCAQRRVLRLAEDGRGDSDAAWAISKGERRAANKGVSTLCLLYIRLATGRARRRYRFVGRTHRVSIVRLSSSLFSAYYYYYHLFCGARARCAESFHARPRA